MPFSAKCDQSLKQHSVIHIHTIWTSYIIQYIWKWSGSVTVVTFQRVKVNGTEDLQDDAYGVETKAEGGKLGRAGEKRRRHNQREFKQGETQKVAEDEKIDEFNNEEKHSEITAQHVTLAQYTEKEKL